MDDFLDSLLAAWLHSALGTGRAVLVDMAALVDVADGHAHDGQDGGRGWTARGRRRMWV